MKPNAEHIAPDNQEVAERFPTFRKRASRIRYTSSQ